LEHRHRTVHGCSAECPTVRCFNFCSSNVSHSEAGLIFVSLLKTSISVRSSITRDMR
jgi:hypothetical protein